MNEEDYDLDKEISRAEDLVDRVKEGEDLDDECDSCGEINEHLGEDCSEYSEDYPNGYSLEAYDMDKENNL